MCVSMGMPAPWLDPIGRFVNSKAGSSDEEQPHACVVLTSCTETRRDQSEYNRKKHQSGVSACR
jgi:hypothetical protein